MMFRLSLISALACLFLCCIGSSSGATTISPSNATDFSNTTAANVSNTTAANVSNTTPANPSSDTTTNTSSETASPSNSTSNSSMAANATAITITPVMTTTTPTTTTKSPYDVQHNTGAALYALKLTVGQDNTSNIQYTNASLTSADLLSQLRSYFSNISVDVSLISNNTANQAMGPFILRVEFRVTNPNSTSDLQNMVTGALQSIDNSPDFSVPSSSGANEAVRQFFAGIMDVCSAENVCPLGFTCNSQGCQHMCRTRDCSGHGVCYTSVDNHAVVTTLCQCDSGYETEYMGDNCQDSRRGRLQIIAIIAGVLGAACLVFIIIIIIMCCKYCRHKSSSNYAVSGASYPNNAYDNTREK